MSSNHESTISRRREAPLPESSNRSEQIAYLTHEFRFPGDYSKIIQDFDRGNSQVRDVGMFTKRGRQLVIDSMHPERINQMTDSEIGEFGHVTQAAAHSFAEAMRATDSEYIQKFAGWNFLVNSSAYRDRGFAWAKNFDRNLAAWRGSSNSGIDAMLSQGANADISMRLELARYADVNPINIAWHLAGRSLSQEAFHTREYGQDFTEAKKAAFRTVMQLASHSNLPQEHLNRALLQLQKSELSAFDHLTGGVTTYDAGSLGDYEAGSLRVEVKANGSPRRATRAERPQDTLRHELFHSASAQELRTAPNSPNVIRFVRIGLRAMNTGLDVNEGMTEFLNLYSAGFITTDSRGVIQLRLSGSYDKQVISMVQIYASDRRLFDALFNTYLGDSSNPNDTRLGLEAFYEKFDQN